MNANNNSMEELQRAAALTDSWLNAVLTEQDSKKTITNNAVAVVERIFPSNFLLTAQQEISAWPNYSPTELHPLIHAAASAGVGALYFKDEGSRFGLGSFKALGGAYAVIHWLAGELSSRLNKPVSMEDVRTGRYAAEAADITVVSATDGNHGRSVAWGAQLAGCPCQIYIHKEVSVGREQAVEQFGATVIRVNGDYDESVRQCASDAKANQWQVISDTSYPGYTDVPRLVMAGYTIMVTEILDALEKPPTHIIVQAGVGGLAAAVSAAFVSRLGVDAPRVIVVESEHADCIIKSLSAGEPKPVDINKETMMAGLSCGEISLLAFDVLKECVSGVLTLPDTEVPRAMRVLAMGHAGGGSIEAGECAVPGVIALLALMKSEPLKKSLGLNEHSSVVVFGCEGATDPVIYQRIISGQM